MYNVMTHVCNTLPWDIRMLFDEIPSKFIGGLSYYHCIICNTTKDYSICL